MGFSICGLLYPLGSCICRVQHPSGVLHPRGLKSHPRSMGSCFVGVPRPSGSAVLWGPTSLGSHIHRILHCWVLHLFHPASLGSCVCWRPPAVGSHISGISYPLGCCVTDVRCPWGSHIAGVQHPGDLKSMRSPVYAIPFQWDPVSLGCCICSILCCWDLVSIGVYL